MRVFADYHHSALYESLRLLFEERLGWKLYKPIGTEWYTNGYWKLHTHPDTVNQYLSINDNSNIDPFSGNLHRHCYEEPHITTIADGYYERLPACPKQALEETSVVHRGLRFNQFLEMDIDIILYSIQAHQAPFRKLRDKYKPNAKLIYQIGNNGWYPNEVNSMISTSAMIPSGRHGIQYHQEFRTDIFYPREPISSKSITNVTSSMSAYSKSQLNSLKQHLPEWVVKQYGQGNPDNVISSPVQIIADIIKDSGFIWHVKEIGDGYGHNIYGAFACGKPIITDLSHFRGMKCMELLQDGLTCIDIHGKTSQQIAQILTVAADNYDQWSSRVTARFKECVNFDQEAIQINKFLEELR